LEAILGIVYRAQKAPAGPQHQRPVPPQQSFDGRLVALLDEPFQQFGVADTGAGGRRDAAQQAADGSVQRISGHATSLVV
jgi:hypothetical protein